VPRVRNGQAVGLERAGGRQDRSWRPEAIATPGSARESVLLVKAGTLPANNLCATNVSSRTIS